MSRAADPDALLLRRASRTVAVRTAAAVGVVVVVMAATVLLLDIQQQHQQADQISRSTWATADDVSDPPPDTWLLIDPPHGRPRRVTPGAPAAVARLDPATLANGRSHFADNGNRFVVFTGRRPLGRVSAVTLLDSNAVEKHRLELSLAIAALLGIAGAAVVGALIGRRAVRPLGEAIALQRRFVADASHELRTPISVLLLRAQLLRRHLDGIIDPDRTGELDRLVHDTKVLGDVVADMLLSAELAHQPRRGEPVDLLALARELAESMHSLADQRGVDLACEPSSAPLVFVVDGTAPALRRAIAALVDNAIAHTAAGGHVRIRLSAEAGQVRLAVLDDGEGLDPRQAGRLVQRFSRGTAGGSGRRFGLGLALVEEVARSHRGHLRVDGEPGAGATFTLSFPATAAQFHENSKKTPGS